MVHLYNGLVLALLYVGVAYRRKRRIHVPIMISGFILDMISVIYLEFNRDVIGIAVDKSSAYVMQIHLVFAVLTLVCYAVALCTGRKLLKGHPVRRVHRINAMIFLVVRTGIFVTSFLVLEL